MSSEQQQTSQPTDTEIQTELDQPVPPQKRGGFLGNLAFNIIIPVIVLSRFSGEDSLGPSWSIVVALAFPIAYGLWDLKESGKVNAFSVIGVVSVFLTGGISLLELDPQYIAIKEAAVPGAIGLAVLGSQFTKYPLVRVLILNAQLIRVDALHSALSAKGNTALFDRRLAQASLIVASSFFLSSVLNYVLARMILTAAPGTSEFSEQLGRMTALSYPVIAIPSMIVLLIAIWFVFSQIHRLTGKKLESFLIEAG